jgi:sugar phosphate isomerase/epimerase
MTIGINVFQTGGRMGGIEGHEGPITPKSYLNSIKAIADMGFRHVELMADPLLVALSSYELKSLMDQVALVGEERELSFSVHAPFWWIDITAPADEIRTASVATITNVIELTRPISPSHIVIHPFNPALPGRINKSRSMSESFKAAALERYLADAVMSINEVAEHVTDRRSICLENMPNDIAHSLLEELAEKTDTSICFDSGHSYLHTFDVQKSLDRFYSRATAIHAHNVVLKKTSGEKDCKMQDHRSLRTGLIDNRELLRNLTERDYKGHFVVEVMRYDDALDSVEFLKELKFI